MQIRSRLTYQFTGIVASVLFFSILIIYLVFSQIRQREFTIRLKEKAAATAKLLLETQNVDAALLKLIDRNLLGMFPQEKVIIINTKNEEIYSTDERKRIVVTTEVIEKIRKQNFYYEKWDEFEIIGINYAFQGNDYVVIAAANDIYGKRKVRFLGIILTSVFFFSLVVVYYSGWVFAGRALKPISKVINEVDSISVTTLNARVDEGNGQDEIAHLAQTFNKLLERIEAAFKAQRAFVGNASHELRNPLSIIRGQLEVALLKKRQPEEYKKILQSLLEDINQITLIANRMLSLAQVSGAGIVDPKSEVRIDDLLIQTRSELLEIIPEYSVNISFEPTVENEEALNFSGNERLLKIAFYNLIENACKYSPDHACIVEIGIENKNIVIRFSDKGVGIPKEDLHNIFEPFYRGKNVIDRKGHGIGLSLVDKIITLHGGKVKVETMEKQGTTFTITL